MLFFLGKGEEIGEYLVQHPKISIISFTGSFEVGAQIIKKAGQISQDQKDIKKCIVEMGGKNAIVIDSSADMDEAISGVLSSAFGFQGQKCSACSRVIVLEDVYKNFMKRFLPAVESLVIGKPENPQSNIGPLIDENSFKRIKNFIRQEKSQKLFESSFKTENSSWFCPPIVYLTDKGDSALMKEELFAPVLAVFKVKDLESAIRQVNISRFGLTTAFYSRHPSHIEKFKNLGRSRKSLYQQKLYWSFGQAPSFWRKKNVRLGKQSWRAGIFKAVFTYKNHHRKQHEKRICSRTL